MKRFFMFALTLLFTVGAVQVNGQSFLKKVGKAIEKEVGKKVEDKLNELKGEKKPEVAEQPQQKQTAATTQAAPAAKSQRLAPTVLDTKPSMTLKGKLNNHEWVDLGLPSGTRWASCNVDATTPSQPGKHYAWGEIATKTSYTPENNKYYKKDIADISGDKANDVAAAKWGNGWRMPTKAEFDELVHYCNWSYVQQGGRWGALISSTVNDQSIFLPATGMKEGSSLQEASGCGNYWTSTPLRDQWNNGAHEYHFGAALGEMGVGDRAYGYAVRPVVDNADMINTPSQGETNGHKWVDLGLPSGTKWATCNVGAENSEEHGEHFAWSEITPVLDKTSPKNQAKGKWMSGIGGSTSYDAATAHWGEGWRMPTKMQFQELLDNCTFEWTYLGRMKGCKLTSKINGNYIFLPAAGTQAINYVYPYPTDLNRMARYWASTPSKDEYNYKADGLLIAESYIGTSTQDRNTGCSIRPVTK